MHLLSSLHVVLMQNVERTVWSWTDVVAQLSCTSWVDSEFDVVAQLSWCDWRWLCYHVKFKMLWLTPWCTSSLRYVDVVPTPPPSRWLAPRTMPTWWRGRWWLKGFVLVGHGRHHDTSCCCRWQKHPEFRKMAEFRKILWMLWPKFFLF